MVSLCFKLLRLQTRVCVSKPWMVKKSDNNFEKKCIYNIKPDYSLIITSECFAVGCLVSLDCFVV